MAGFVFLIVLFLSIHCFSVASSSEPLFFPLTHPLSEFNTTQQLLQSTSARSAARSRRHAHPNNRRQLSISISSTDYTLSFTIGSSPARRVSIYLDTGSDLVWFPCSPFECILCEGKYGAGGGFVVNITSAASVGCKNPACAAAHASASASDLCAVASCPLEEIETGDCAAYDCPDFYYAYGDGSLVARLRRDTLSIGPSSRSLTLHNFTFACSHTALAEPVGVAGFGPGVLSLPAQLGGLSPRLGRRFSYCLVSHSFNPTRLRLPSPLILGRSSVSDGGADSTPFVYAPLLTNTLRPYLYSVALDAITLGDARIPAPASLRQVDFRGNGGMVVDSGTTYTMLPSNLFLALVDELDSRLLPAYRRAGETEVRTGLRPCYLLGRAGDARAAAVPKLAFQLGGNATVWMPKRNYFYEFLDGGDGERVGCLMVMDGGDELESAVLGNYQQQGLEVAYDLERRRVGFARRKCAALWATLNGR